jgi:hypothetical protein
MRVEVEPSQAGFRYRIFPERDDPDRGRRAFSDSPRPFLVVHRAYEVRLPGSFRTLHPDLHALAIWHVLRPVVSSRLELPFAVSPELAGRFEAQHGVRVVRVDDHLSPRRAPAAPVPALLFSGGLDSMAASLLLPEATQHLFLDRIPHARRRDPSGGQFDLAEQRAACATVQADGRAVHATRDDHEHLFLPYPMWHSPMPWLAALYLADSLDLGIVDTGEVLDAKCFRGYHAGEVSSWRLRPPGSGYGPRRADPWFAPEGLGLADSIGGLSEVATSRIVARSHLRGRSYSCYYPSGQSYCLRCDKCFKKLILQYIADDEEVPEALFERFVAQPHLARIFSRPYLDWHHVWYYLFQRIRCRHWFAEELQRQAQGGPDLGALEKWYPPAQHDMAPAYEDEVRDRIERLVGAMSPAEVDHLEHLEVPPLHAPPLPRVAQAPGVGPGPAAEVVPAEALALYRLLSAKLGREQPPTFGGWELRELFLEPGEDGVFLALGESLVLRLARRSAALPRPAARIGALGIWCDRDAGVRPAERRKVLVDLVPALVQAFREAQAELCGS